MKVREITDAKRRHMVREASRAVAITALATAAFSPPHSVTIRTVEPGTRRCSRTLTALTPLKRWRSSMLHAGPWPGPSRWRNHFLSDDRRQHRCRLPTPRPALAHSTARHFPLQASLSADLPPSADDTVEEEDEVLRLEDENELLAAAAAAAPEVAAATLRRRARARARSARVQKVPLPPEHIESYRITTYCTAKEYDMVRTLRRMRVWSNNRAHFVDDSLVLHARPRRAAATDEVSEEQGDVFIFRYGVVVMWNLTVEEEQAVLTVIRSFCERDGLDVPESDDFEYEVGGELPRFVADTLILPESSVLAKLAASHGLAQSVKLSSFEDSVQRSIEATRGLAAELAATGAIVSRSRRDIAMTLGNLVMDRHILYLFADVLDSPDVIWHHPEYDSQYRVVERYLELPQRVELLNKRVDVVRELLNLLSNELQFKHSSRLELIIIALIMLEILLALAKDLVPLALVTFRRGHLWAIAGAMLFVGMVLAILVAVVAENYWQRPRRRWWARDRPFWRPLQPRRPGVFPFRTHDAPT